jgi:hypothetical protein
LDMVAENDGHHRRQQLLPGVMGPGFRQDDIGS